MHKYLTLTLTIFMTLLLKLKKRFFLLFSNKDIKTTHTSRAGDDILFFRQTFLVFKFLFRLTLKTVWVALQGYAKTLILLFNYQTWIRFGKAICTGFLKKMQQTLRGSINVAANIGLFLVRIPMRFRIGFFSAKVAVKQQLSHWTRVSLIFYNYFIIHICAVGLVLEHSFQYLKLYRTTTPLIVQIQLYFLNSVFSIRLLAAFCYSVITVRLKDAQIPEAIETGYPLSWYDVARLCEAMYQNNGFFFWTLTENVNTQLIMKLKDFHNLPLYLETGGSNLTFSSVPDFLSYLKQHYNREDLPYIFSEDISRELYETFIENFKYILLEELKNDPFAVIRANLVDYQTLNEQNLYDQYFLKTGLFDKILKRWDLTFETNSEQILAFTLRKGETDEYSILSGIRSEEDFLTYCSKKHFFDIFSNEWGIYCYQLYVELFFSYYPYLFFWGKATQGMGGVMLPIFAIFGKPFYYTPEPLMLIIFGLWTYYYSYYFIKMDSASDFIIPIEVLYEDWYLDFRFDCMFFLDFDPEGEEEYDFVQYFIPWILIAPYIDKRKRVSNYKHLYSLPDYRKYLVSAARRLYSGKVTEDAYLAPYISEVSPLMILMDQWNDRGYKFVRMYKGVRNKVWPIANYDCRVSSFYAEDELFILNLLDNLFVRTTHHGGADDYYNPILVDAVTALKRNRATWRPYSFTGFTRTDKYGFYFRYRETYNLRRTRLYEYDFELAKYRPYAWKKIFKPLYKHYTTDEWERLYNSFGKCWLPFEYLGPSNNPNLVRQLPVLTAHSAKYKTIDPYEILATNGKSPKTAGWGHAAEHELSRFVYSLPPHSATLGKIRVRDIVDSETSHGQENVRLLDRRKTPVEPTIFGKTLFSNRNQALRELDQTRNHFFKLRRLRGSTNDSDFEPITSHVEVWNDYFRKTWHRKRMKSVLWWRKGSKTAPRLDLRGSVYSLHYKDHSFFPTIKYLLTDFSQFHRRAQHAEFFSRKKWRDLDYLPPSDHGVSRILLDELFRISDVHHTLSLKTRRARRSALNRDKSVMLPNRTKRGLNLRLENWFSLQAKVNDFTHLKPNLVNKYFFAGYDKFGTNDQLHLLIAANYAKLLRNGGATLYNLLLEPKKAPFINTSSVSHLLSYIYYSPHNYLTRGFRTVRTLRDLTSNRLKIYPITDLSAEKLYTLLFNRQKSDIEALFYYYYGASNLSALKALENAGLDLYNRTSGIITLQQWLLGGDFHIDYTYNQYSLDKLSTDEYLHYTLLQFQEGLKNLFFSSNPSYSNQFTRLPGDIHNNTTTNVKQFQHRQVEQLSWDKYFQKYFNSIDDLPRHPSNFRAVVSEQGHVAMKLAPYEAPLFDIELAKMSQSYVTQYFSTREHLTLISKIARNAPGRDIVGPFPQAYLLKTINNLVSTLDTLTLNVSVKVPSMFSNQSQKLYAKLDSKVTSLKRKLGVISVEEEKLHQRIQSELGHIPFWSHGSARTQINFLEALNRKSDDPITTLSSLFKSLLLELSFHPREQLACFDLFKRLDQVEQIEVVLQLYSYYKQHPNFNNDKPVQLFGSTTSSGSDFLNFSKVNWLNHLFTHPTTPSFSLQKGIKNADLLTLKEKLEHFVQDLTQMSFLPAKRETIVSMFRLLNRKRAWSQLYQQRQLRYQELKLRLYRKQYLEIHRRREEYLSEFFGPTWIAKMVRYLPEFEDALANFHFFRRPIATRPVWPTESGVRKKRPNQGPILDQEIDIFAFLKKKKVESEPGLYNPKPEQPYTDKDDQTILYLYEQYFKELFLETLHKTVGADPTLRLRKLSWLYRPKTRKELLAMRYNKIYVPTIAYDRSRYVKTFLQDFLDTSSFQSWFSSTAATSEDFRFVFFNQLNKLTKEKSYRIRARKYQKDLLLTLRAKYLGNSKINKPTLKLLRRKRLKGVSEEFYKVKYRPNRPQSRQLSFVEYLNNQLTILGGIKPVAPVRIHRYKILSQRAFLASVHESVNATDSGSMLGPMVTQDKQSQQYYGFIMGQARLKSYTINIVDPWLSESSDNFLLSHRQNIDDILAKDLEVHQRFLKHSAEEFDLTELKNTHETLFDRDLRKALSDTLIKTKYFAKNDLTKLMRPYLKRRLDGEGAIIDDLFSSNLNEWYQILQSSTESQLVSNLSSDLQEAAFREIQIGPDEWANELTLSARLMEQAYIRKHTELFEIDAMFFYYKWYYLYELDKDFWHGATGTRDITKFVPLFDATLRMNVLPEFRRSHVFPRHNKLKYQRLYDMRAITKLLLAETMVLPQLDGFHVFHQSNWSDAFEYSIDFEEDFEVPEDRTLLLTKKGRGRSKVSIWTSTRGGLREMYEQSLLVGVYNATQLNDSPYHLFLQTQSLFTPLDLYGVYCENSLGHSPNYWFSFYDQTENTVRDPLPYLPFAFKNTSLLIRSQGYYQPDPLTAYKVNTEFSLLENIESIMTGFSEMEARVGLEYAITFYWYNYFGITPGAVLDFVLYSCYWTTNWLNALYNGMFIDAHLQHLPINRPETGLIDFEPLTKPFVLPKENINWFVYDNMTQPIMTEQYHLMNSQIYERSLMFLFELVFVRLAEAVNSLDKYAFPTNTRPRKLLDRILEDKRLADLASGKLPPETETFSKKYSRSRQWNAEARNIMSLNEFQSAVTRVYFFANSYQKSGVLMKLHESITRFNLVSAESYLSTNEQQIYAHISEFGEDNAKADMVYLRGDMSLRNKEMLKEFYNFLMWCQERGLALVFRTDPFTNYYLTPNGQRFLVIWGDDFNNAEANDFIKKHKRPHTHVHLMPEGLTPSEVEERLSKLLYKTYADKVKEGPIKLFVKSHNKWLSLSKFNEVDVRFYQEKMLGSGYGFYLNAPQTTDEALLNGQFGFKKPKFVRIEPKVLLSADDPVVQRYNNFDPELMARKIEEFDRIEAKRQALQMESVHRANTQEAMRRRPGVLERPEGQIFYTYPENRRFVPRTITWEDRF